MRPLKSNEKYGLDDVEIWFADTRMEDDDLYRFNRDVENYSVKRYEYSIKA